MIFCGRGTWRVNGHDAPLASMQALLWQSGLPAMRVQPTGPGSRLVVVRLIRENPAP